MDYHSPTKLASAFEIAALANGKVIAGGTDVYPAQKQGKHPQRYLDVTQIAGFDNLTITDDGYRFGAAMSWSKIIKANLPPAFDGLKAAAREVGSLQIQNPGTIAGNLCNASPAADGIPPFFYA